MNSAIDKIWQIQLDGEQHEHVEFHFQFRPGERPLFAILMEAVGANGANNQSIEETDDRADDDVRVVRIRRCCWRI